VLAYDVFNGDADGICALAQLRLAEPKESVLISGIKRDIELLEQVPLGQAATITALDISFDKNRDRVSKLLASGSSVFYCDHHYAGELPEHPNLTTIINTAPEVCTSLLINGFLKGAFAPWAVVGAFGDNLARSAHALAATLALSDQQIQLYSRLGLYLNYNGYGPSLDDLYFHPETLYRAVVECSTPDEFVDGQATIFATLAEGYRSDMNEVSALGPEYESGAAAAYILPNVSWARRVSGVFSNSLVEQHPNRAHAILTDLGDAHFLVSIRAPLNRREGADTLARQFATGGGRSAAAGINRLPADALPQFLDAFAGAYSL
jgi:single-stranded DNA-specific DHH superfamily exonuclease